MRIKIKEFYKFCIALFCMLIYAINPSENSLVYFWIFSFITAWIVIDVIMQSYKAKSLIGFFPIANSFIGLIFFFRPLQILSSGNINAFSVISRYSTYYGVLSVEDLPWAKTALIGLMGTICFNIPFFINHESNSYILRNIVLYKDDYVYTKKQFAGIAVFSLLALSLAGVYTVKVASSTALHIYDLIWVYLLSCIFIYTITRKRKADLFVYAILGLSVLLMSYKGKRQYAINMLLCFICSIYFAGKDRKKSFIQIGVLLLASLVTVFIYGNVRRELIGALQVDSFTDGILGEFCMFDMLLTSLKYVKDQGIGLFWGYNYLSIFTIPIPGITITPFDHMFTDIIYSGRFNGGIPSSLFGSLFLNFSYAGVCVGSLTVGALLRKIQKKLSNANGYYSIGYYSIFSTFVYDIIRVGDIGREVWSVISFLLIYIVFSFVMKRIANEKK